jgi:hypothetical protein
MAGTREDVMVLLKLDEVYKPGTDARKFVYSDELAAVVGEGTFFEVYSLDSDERFWINEVATYFEMLATLWEDGIVDRPLALDWAGAVFYWQRIGPILVQARDVFDHDQLWTGFEALALAQAQG